MAKQSIAQLKNWFKAQAKPAQSQFWDLIDSFRHKDTKIVVNDFEDSLKNLLQNIPDGVAIGNALSDLNNKFSTFTTAAFLGNAEVETNPGTPTSQEWYFGKPATYNYFLDVDGNPITVYATADGLDVLTGILLFNGTHWEALYLTIDLSVVNIRIAALETDLPYKLEKIVGKNLYNPNDPDILNGAYYNSSGTLITGFSPDLELTGFIPISVGQTLIVNYATISGASFVLFDANKNYLSGSATAVGADRISYMSGAAYARFGYQLVDSTPKQIEVGTVVTAYEPYNDYAPVYNLEKRVDDLETDVTTISSEIATTNSNVSALLDQVDAFSTEVTSNIVALKDDLYAYTNAASIVNTIDDTIIGGGGITSPIFTTYKVIVFPCVAGKKLRVIGATNGSVRAFAFFSDSACTTLVQLGTSITAYTAFDDIITPPIGANFIGLTKNNTIDFTIKNAEAASNNAILKTTQSLSNGEKVIARDNIEAASDVVFQQVQNDVYVFNVSLTPVSTIADFYIHQSGSKNALSGYDIKVYTLAGLNKIRIAGNQTGNNIANFAFYSDIACTSLISIGSINASGSNAFDSTVNIPFGATHVGVTQLNSNICEAYDKAIFAEEVRSSLQADIDVIEDKIIELDNLLTFTNKQSVHNSFANSYLHVYNGLSTYSNYVVNVFDLQGKKKLKIQGTQFINQYFLIFAFYSDSACTNLIAIGDYYTNNTTVSVSKIVDVPEGANYIAVTVFSDNAMNIYFDEIVAGVNNAINCFGDSLTFGAGGDGFSYPSYLADKTGYIVKNYGVGGENTITILGRQGSIPFKLMQDAVIPATTTSVAIGNYLLSAFNNYYTQPLVQGAAGVNPVTVDGIECTLSLDAGTYYLTRNVAGTSRNVYMNEPVYTNAAKVARNGKAYVFFIGTNVGGFDTNAELIGQYKQAISFCGSQNYLLIGLHYRFGWNLTQLETLEADMQKEFGARYFNNRKYLITNALIDAGITATSGDNAAIAAGECPPSLLVDAIHFNPTGYKLLANKIFERLVNLGVKF